MTDAINNLMGEHTIAVMTMKDPHLRRVRDAVIRKAPEDLKNLKILKIFEDLTPTSTTAETTFT